MKKKKILKFLPYLLFLSLILYTRGSSIVNNLGLEGEKIPSNRTTSISPSLNKSLIFPPPGNSITIFWHSQCGPCKVEMKRLKDSVANNKIDSNKIFAINPFESETEIKMFLKKNPYSFQFIKDNGISRALNIEVTPTTVFIKDNKLESINTGMSLIGIWLAESFI